MKFSPNCRIECEDKFTFCNQRGSKLQEIIELFFVHFAGIKWKLKEVFVLTVVIS